MQACLWAMPSKYTHLRLNMHTHAHTQTDNRVHQKPVGDVVKWERGYMSSNASVCLCISCVSLYLACLLHCCGKTGHRTSGRPLPGCLLYTRSSSSCHEGGPECDFEGHCDRVCNRVRFLVACGCLRVCSCTPCSSWLPQFSESFSAWRHETQTHGRARSRWPPRCIQR